MRDIFFRRDGELLEIGHNLKGGLQVLPTNRFLIFVRPDNLRNIEDIVLWRIGIFFESTDLLFLGNLCH